MVQLWCAVPQLELCCAAAGGVLRCSGTCSIVPQVQHCPTGAALSHRCSTVPQVQHCPTGAALSHRCSTVPQVQSQKGGAPRLELDWRAVLHIAVGICPQASKSTLRCLTAAGAWAQESHMHAAQLWVHGHRQVECMLCCLAGRHPDGQRHAHAACAGPHRVRE